MRRDPPARPPWVEALKIFFLGFLAALVASTLLSGALETRFGVYEGPIVRFVAALVVAFFVGGACLPPATRSHWTVLVPAGVVGVPATLLIFAVPVGEVVHLWQFWLAIAAVLGAPVAGWILAVKLRRRAMEDV